MRFDELQSRRCRLGDDDARRHTLAGVGAWTASAFAVLDDADAPLRPERPRDVPQQPYRILRFVKRINDDHGIQRIGWQFRIRMLAEHRRHDARQSFAFDAASDRFDHQALHVDRIDAASAPDTPRQPHGEPTSARPEIGDRRPFGHMECIHHLIRFLPCLAIGRLEQPQILRREQAWIAWRLLLQGRLEGRHYGRGRGRRDDGAGDARVRSADLQVGQSTRGSADLQVGRSGDQQQDNADACHLAGVVIRSGASSASSSESVSTPRSFAICRIDLPVRTDSFTISAVAA